MKRLLAVVLVLSGVTAAAAQSARLDRGTSLAISAGASRANGDTGGAVGGSASWELTTYFALEGAGRWMDRGEAPGAFAGELCARVGLGGTRDGAIPYLVAGVGAHRRTFDVHGPGEAAALPEFYRRRVALSAGSVGARQTFTDPTIVVGVGVDVAISRTVVLRPDVRAIVVVDGRRRDTVVAATVGVGYRFDHRPVTPTQLLGRVDR
jgi:hypothetical protein